MLPQTNARLVSIATGTSVQSEDWDQPAGSATAYKWQGDEDAYIEETVRTVYAQQAGALVKVRDIQLTVSDTLADSVDIQTGDILSYLFKDIMHTRRIMEYESPYLPTIPAFQRYTTLHLNPEPLEIGTENQ